MELRPRPITFVTEGVAGDGLGVTILFTLGP